MNDEQAFKYIKRRELLTERQKYLNQMIDALNNDPAFVHGHVRFSPNNNNFHFVERFGDRKFPIKTVLPLFFQFILQHRCEIIYFCNLDNPPLRLELDIDSMLMGLTVKHGSLCFRTMIDKSDNRKDGVVSFMRISNNRHYYEYTSMRVKNETEIGTVAEAD